MELRCDAKLHGILRNRTLEVKCDSRFCGHRPGVVVLHTFDLESGELISTERYKTPLLREKEQGT